jgi:hypothetical protein
MAFYESINDNTFYEKSIITSCPGKFMAGQIKV